MVQNFVMPPVGFGPGSQAPLDEGDQLEYMPLPQDMRTYAPHLPEVEVGPALTPALDLLAEISAACASGTGHSFDLTGMDAANRALIAETMGEGEVSAKLLGIPAIAVQESVFAGVWMLNGAGVQRIEVAPIPVQAKSRAFSPTRLGKGASLPQPEGVINGPALLVELIDKSAQYNPEAPLHVINLSLLPHTEEDLIWLDAALGLGSVTILSRGYGNCRISATALAHVWRVQFFNSTDALILDTFEVTDMPEVALAAPEDLTDSADRIAKVLEAIR